MTYPLNSPRIRVRLGIAVAVAMSLAALPSQSQDAVAPTKQPLEHVIGTVSAVDGAAHTITIKEDKTGAERVIQLANTKTLLKVDPGAKDLKNATRITADDLASGDRVDVRGTKPDEASTAIAARSVVLMSARDLQQAQQAQAAAWQHGTSGTVSSVDAASGKISISARTADGPKPMVVETSSATAFTRYSPDNPKLPTPSQLAQIQAGDQVRVIGDKNADGTTVTASKVYSGAFRTISATISAIGADGKSITVKDLASKKPVEIALNDETSVRKLPPMMAMMLARRFNPNFKAANAASGGSGTPGAGSTDGGGMRAQPAQSSAAAAADSTDAPKAQAAGGNWQRGANGGGQGGGMRGAGGGDVSQMLERVPKITLAELKPGDALVISGVATGADNSRLLANNVIAGVEPILQSAPQQQGGRGGVGGDWGLGGEMAAPQ